MMLEVETVKIRDILAEKDITISFEVFPPKTDAGFDKVTEAAGKIAALGPDFMSVTYGAGGGTSKNTAAIAYMLQNMFQVPTLAHLTCVSSSKETVHAMLDKYKELGIENIMALRGDLPKDGNISKDFAHAVDLIRDIRESDQDICIGAACYPEGHMDCPTQSEDIRHLKEKVDAGVDFLTTQMIFDNEQMYHFLYNIRSAGIDVPVLPGIMPITNAKQVGRSAAMSGSYIPQKFHQMVDRFGDNPEKMKQAGIIYASEQIIDLIANGVSHIHVYSMNKPDVAAGILENIKLYLN